MNLLEIIQEFAERTGVLRPTAVASSIDPQVRQLRALLNEEIEEVTRQNTLQALIIEKVHTTTPAEDQGLLDTVAGEPVRYLLNNVMWNRTTRFPVFGPISPQLWQQYKSQPITGTIFQYRVQQDRLFIYPAPPAGHQIAFEFVARNAVLPAGGGPAKELFTADDDTSRVPSVILLAALRWRWKREKGLAYAEDKERYQLIVGDYVLRDGGKKTLRMDCEPGHELSPGVVVPSGSWSL